VLRFLARMTLAVKSPARKSRLTMAELWLFFARLHHSRTGRIREILNKP